jgi:hypothetical protein
MFLKLRAPEQQGYAGVFDVTPKPIPSAASGATQAFST